MICLSSSALQVVACHGESVWQAHNDSIPTAGGSGEVRQLSEEDLKALEGAFEQVQYFTEDLDHAKGQDLLPAFTINTFIPTSIY